MIADLDAVADFLNTRDERTFTRHGAAFTPHDELPAGDAGRPLRDALRAALRRRDRLAERDAGSPGARAGLPGLPAEVNDVLAGVRLDLHAAPDGSLHLAGDPMVLAVAAAVVTGAWARLKMCAAPDCGWVFVDRSRSGAGRWCSMNSCGNRHKTASYRQRHRAG